MVSRAKIAVRLMPLVTAVEQHEASNTYPNDDDKVEINYLDLKCLRAVYHDIIDAED